MISIFVFRFPFLQFGLYYFPLSQFLLLSYYPAIGGKNAVLNQYIQEQDHNVYLLPERLSFVVKLYVFSYTQYHHFLEND